MVRAFLRFSLKLGSNAVNTFSKYSTFNAQRSTLPSYLPSVEPSTDMGCQFSLPDTSGKRRSDEIDRGDMDRLKPECKVLVLGLPGSGKSMVMKQMECIYACNKEISDGFSKAELEAVRPTIYMHVLRSAHQVILYMRKVGLECVKSSNKMHKELMDKILDYRLEPRGTNTFSTEIAEAIHQLSIDPIFPKVMDNWGYSEDPDHVESVRYFFQSVLRVGAPGYLPNATDKLRASPAREIRINMASLSICMLDIVNPCVSLENWVHCSESVTSIIFCVALSDYDHVLPEDKTKTRLSESLNLFEAIVNSQWPSRPSIILLLNKIDVFREKLPVVPLEQYFPEYSGGNDINKAAKYMLWKFMQRNRARLSVYPYIIQATDTSNLRIVFAAVKETILQTALENCGIMRWRC